MSELWRTRWEVRNAKTIVSVLFFLSRILPRLMLYWKRAKSGNLSSAIPYTNCTHGDSRLYHRILPPWDKISHMAPLRLGDWDNLQHTRAGYLGYSEASVRPACHDVTLGSSLPHLEIRRSVRSSLVIFSAMLAVFRYVFRGINTTSNVESLSQFYKIQQVQPCT